MNLDNDSESFDESFATTRDVVLKSEDDGYSNDERNEEEDDDDDDDDDEDEDELDDTVPEDQSIIEICTTTVIELYTTCTTIFNTVLKSHTIKEEAICTTIDDKFNTTTIDNEFNTDNRFNTNTCKTISCTTITTCATIYGIFITTCNTISNNIRHYYG